MFFTIHSVFESPQQHDCSTASQDFHSSLQTFQGTAGNSNQQKRIGTTQAKPPLLLRREESNCISKQLEEKKVTRSSQHAFTRRKSCLTTLIAFSDVITGWMDGGKAVDVVYLDLARHLTQFPTASFTMKFKKCRINVWMVKWFETGKV